ncbi:MAG: Ig-like domain-containing protein [Myxococcota bacterium]
MCRCSTLILALCALLSLTGCPTDEPVPAAEDAGDGDQCVPLTCSDLGVGCGEHDDGCGETIVCDACPASVVVTPNPLEVKLGSDAQLSAEVKSSDGGLLEDAAVAWDSNNPDIASVDDSGLVTGHAVGSTQIAVSAGEISESVDVSVTETSVARVEIQSEDLDLALGQTAELTAKTFDSGDNELSGRAVNWSSSDGEVADVSSSGTVEAVGAGQATISAEVEGVSDQISVVVEAQDVSSVQIRPAGPHVLRKDDTLSLQAAATAVGGGEAFCNFQWSSSNPSAATVDSSGVVTGKGAGITSLTAECRGASDSVVVYANDSNLSDALLDPADLKLWLRADVGVDFAGGNRVEAWRDISGNELTLRSQSFSQHPDRINSAVNSQPVLRFFGDQDLRLSSSSIELPRAAIFVVVKNSEPTRTGRILSNCLVDHGTHHLSFNGTDTGLAVVSDAGIDMNVSLASTTSEYQVFALVIGDSQITVYENGSPQSVENSTVAGSWFFQQIGAECNALGMEGDVAEVLLYDRALPETEREAVESYLMTRYGL